MTRSLVILGLTLAGLSTACTDRAAQSDTTVASQSSAAPRTASAPAAENAVPTAGDSISRAEVIAVVREAYGMAEAPERPAWNTDTAAHRENLRHYYSRRFSDSLARVYADYDGPERIMYPPDSVTVLRLGGDEAEAAYPTPLMLKEIWGRPDYTVDRLRREGGQWRIVGSRGSASRPAGVTAPPT